MKLENKIKLLEVTLENFDNWYFNNGTCGVINKAYDTIVKNNPKFGKERSFFDNIQIREFNRTNAKRLATKYGFQTPPHKIAWWWDTSDRNNRKLFLKYLIQELKNK